MSTLKSIAAGAVIAGSLGMAAIGFGSGMANAAPSPAVGTGWAQWGPHRDPGWGRGPGWGPPPPPPPPAYGYGGYGYAPVNACVNGPLGLLHVCV